MADRSEIREDAELEALIDKAGRQKVFARAATYGWSSYNPPPAWVWRQIAHEILNGIGPSVPPQRLDEALLGFRLM